MKHLLFVYDRMMTGGTTTALLSLLKTIDYSEYSVDLLLYRNEGPFMKEIPPEVKVLKEAHRSGLSKFLNLRVQKLAVGVLDFSIFKALLAYLKYKNTHKGAPKTILFHFLAKPQVRLSRKLDKKYDAAIGFIEGWSDHYVLSNKVNAEHRIVWIHPDYINSYLIPEADRKAFRNADNIVVVSDSCKKNLCEVFPEYADKAVTIENIISAKYLKLRAGTKKPDMKKHSLDICTVCRCDISVKGLDRIVNVFSRLKQENILKDTHWHLIGGGEGLAAVRTMVDEKGISDNVTLYGHMDSPLEYLKEMDLFMLASRYEGKPVSVAESLGLGIPCIVTNYASASEQVNNNVNGVITENSEEGLYSGLKGILQNPSVLNEFKKDLSVNVCDNSDEIERLYCLWR